jgi:hypothetical protein
MATTYTTIAGDVLVVEIGAKWFTASAGVGVSAAIRCGDAGLADLPVDETTGVGVPEQNGWIEFEGSDLFGSIDDPLPTFSASTVAARPAVPDKAGLHFFDRTNAIDYRWTGTSWVQMPYSTVSGTTGVLGFSSTFGVSVTITGSTVTWDAQALSVSGSRGKTLLLTDDASGGALLTADNTFLANAITFIPPNRVSTNIVAIGKYGNMALGSVSLNDFIQLSVLRVETNSATLVQGFNSSASNTGSGSARGGQQSAIASGADLGAPTSAITVTGGLLQATGGASSNDNFQGTIIGGQFTALALAATIGSPVAAAYALQTGGTPGPLSVRLLACAASCRQCSLAEHSPISMPP